MIRHILNQTLIKGTMHLNYMFLPLVQILVKDKFEKYVRLGKH